MELDENLETVGTAQVCATWEARSEEEIVIFEVAREAANVADPAIPSDASIIGKVEKVQID